MKLKTADKQDWKRVTKRSFDMTYKENEHFKGQVAAFHLIEISSPLFVRYGEISICIANSGYTWMQHFPENEHYVVTTVLDQNGVVKQTYIDVCNEQGISEEGIPWFKDLYLDVVVLPSGEIILLDEDELLEALENKTITENESKLAMATASFLINKIKNGDFPLLEVCKTHCTEWFKKKMFI
jgi:uncharacterized protein